jgi:hypothetical protein
VFNIFRFPFDFSDSTLTAAPPDVSGGEGGALATAASRFSLRYLSSSTSSLL